jgi:hypothetical protein
MFLFRCFIGHLPCNDTKTAYPQHRHQEMGTAKTGIRWPMTDKDNEEHKNGPKRRRQRLWYIYIYIIIYITYKVFRLLTYKREPSTPPTNHHWPLTANTGSQTGTPPPTSLHGPPEIPAATVAWGSRHIRLEGFSFLFIQLILTN